MVLSGFHTSWNLTLAGDDFVPFKKLSVLTHSQGILCVTTVAMLSLRTFSSFCCFEISESMMNYLEKIK